MTTSSPPFPLLQPPVSCIGLRNPLASSPSSSQISTLFHSGHTILSPPHLHAPPPSNTTAHAAGSRDLFAYIQDATLCIFDNGLKYHYPTRIHSQPQALAVTRTSSSVVAAIATYDGVFLTILSAAVFTELVAMAGSRSYPCVAVALGDDGTVAGGSMAGQVAIWKLKLGDAAQVIELPEGLHLADRITQVAFWRGDLVVAWWSGHVFCYRDGREVWRGGFQPESSAAFCTKAGTFFELDENKASGVFVAGDERVGFVDLKKGEWVTKKLVAENGTKVVVQGVCVSGQGVYIWIRDALKLVAVEWPGNIADNICAVIGNHE